MKYYRYSQNNSGGNFIGPSTIIIYAENEDEANVLAFENGVYFDGVEIGDDCDCCGDRWHSPDEHDSLDDAKAHIYTDDVLIIGKKQVEFRKELKKIIQCMLIIFYINDAKADGLGFRYNNVATEALQFNGGKIVELTLDHDLSRNVFLEYAAGAYFSNDFDSTASGVVEISPGFKVSTNAIELKLSQGIAYMPSSGLPQLEFATHMSVSLIDSVNGATIGLERTHYSNGRSERSNVGLDMTGLILGFKL